MNVLSQFVKEYVFSVSVEAFLHLFFIKSLQVKTSPNLQSLDSLTRIGESKFC